MIEKSLRALARQYAKGELDRDAYRQSRTEFIEAVLSGTTRMQVNDYPAPRNVARAEAISETTRKRPRRKREAEDVTSVMMATDPTPQSMTPIAAEPAELEAAKAPIAESPPKKYIAIAAVAGLVLLATIILTTRSGGTRSPEPANADVTPTAQDSAPEPAAAATAVTGPAVDRIQKFLNAKNWSEDAKAQFLHEWQALPEDQRSIAMSSGEMAQLNNGIYKKMLEERALSGVGDAAASMAKQRSLIDFAAAIGIHDSRLSVPGAAAQ